MEAILDETHFGTLPDGREINKFHLNNSHGLKMEVISYGGIITSLQVPDRTGRLDDIVLGFDNLDDYLKSHPYFGAIIGRYGNRISHGKFQLDGKEYQLARNLGTHHLHGGAEGFDRKIWKIEPLETNAGPGISLKYSSPEGEEGYPGRLDVIVEYILSESNELIIRYEVTTNAPTIHNLTQHTYFNLNGVRDNIYRHEVEIPSRKVLATDEQLIPTGSIMDVTGTAFDFSQTKSIGRDINDTTLEKAGGYDHCYVSMPDKPCAIIHDPDSGRTMEVHTTEPGFQFYTANSLGEVTGKGKKYGKHSAFCIETQHYPDSPNRPEFPSTRLDPGQRYISETRYIFTAG